MKTALRTLAILTAAIGTASAATSVPQVKTFSYTPDATAALTFNKFNTTLGTLTAITITTSITKSSGSLYLDNDSPLAAEGTVTQTVRLDLTSANNLLDLGFVPIGNNITAVSSFYANLTADTGGDGAGYQWDAGTDNAGTAFGNVTTSTTSNINSAFFGQYSTAGSGTYVINAGATQSVSTSAVGGAAYAGTPSDASGSVTITYTYTAIPEPSSALLGCIGALALLRRRR